MIRPYPTATPPWRSVWSALSSPTLTQQILKRFLITAAIAVLLASGLATVAVGQVLQSQIFQLQQ
ncbi:MAG: hypothetical protein AAF289_16845, partial [Cyanobacteria bacterium P01_A01_bin.135]